MDDDHLCDEFNMKTNRNGSECKMKTAFVCWRPFQIMNAINFMMHDISHTRNNSDLYVMSFPSMKNCVELIKKENLFRNVYVFDDYAQEENVVSRRLTKVADLFFSKAALRRKLNGDFRPEMEDYDQVIATGWELFFVCLAAVNKKAKVILLDDGTGSYMGDFRQREMRTSYKIINRLFGRGALSINVDSMYIDRKELMRGENEYPTYQMPEVTEEVFGILTRIFEYQDNGCYRNKKYIYLAQGFDRSIEGIKCDENEIIAHMQLIKENTCARLHPYQKDQDIGLLQDRDRQMWELVCRNNITDENVLISSFSTAQIIPKILYDREPVLVFLYRFICEGKSYDIMEDYVDYLEKHYRNEIHRPRSLEEFDELLMRLENRVGKS